jgi:hypothetical protein
MMIRFDVPVKRLSLVLSLAFVSSARLASADDHVALGYLVSPPIADSGTGVVHTVAGRWDRMLSSKIELGLGLELGASGGDQPLTRAAILPGAAYVIGTFDTPVGAMTVRVEEQLGWQIVRGRLTLGGIPLRGTEPRGFHEEAALALDLDVNATIAVRARVGVVLDGIFPAGRGSLQAGPFIGLAAVVAP